MTNIINKINNEINFQKLNTPSNNQTSEKGKLADIQKTISDKIEDYEIDNIENNTSEKNNNEEFQLVKSTDLLHNKLIGGLDNLLENWSKGPGMLPMVAYGVVKGSIEEHLITKIPAFLLKINIAECVIVSTISSPVVAKIANIGVEAVNGALFPENWLKYSEETFSEIESIWAKSAKILGDNINILRSGGARLNFAINTLFAGIDAYHVWDYYTQAGQDAIEHIGEIGGRFLGEAVGGAGGFALGAAAGSAAAGAITGAACGSVVPGIGTAAGIIVGAAVGAVGAVVLGDISATAGSYIDGNNGEIAAL